MKQRQKFLREPDDDLDEDENNHDPFQTHGSFVVGLVSEGRVERVEQAQLILDAPVEVIESKSPGSKGIDAGQMHRETA